MAQINHPHRVGYTTNAIESMHMQLRKIVKNHGHFPSDEAASKLLYLALRNIEKDWKMPPTALCARVAKSYPLFASDTRATNSTRPTTGLPCCTAS
ncbi:hypothetical protein WS71_22325 [Burkholderia mayonis]|uniref:Mutator family transposase n=1 Tax=Burkholderia mayonis TaxID=1385591 RepID=A0A1B4G260_9BURK|nr:hypothetical protein WS71_22325 [Burkholderia mayonis]